MRMRSMAIVAVACCATLVAACGPTNPAPSGNPTNGAAPGPAPAPTTPATRAVKDLTPGNCTLFTKADATTQLGPINTANKALDIGTDGGTKIDVCSYLSAKGLTDIQGISYAVVRYDSAATAFAEAQKVQTEMLGSAAEHDWPVQTLTTPAPGAGQVLGGYGTKTEDGVPFTIAVVGTNVGPYLVVALGGSTESADNAKKFALTAFQMLNTAVS